MTCGRSLSAAAWRLFKLGSLITALKDGAIDNCRSILAFGQRVARGMTKWQLRFASVFVSK